MTLDTLNLQGDEDLESAIEAAFDLRFADSELMSMVTVGSIHDVINARIAPQDGRCETSMTFYRLRRGLIELGMAGRIDPDTPLPVEFSRQPNLHFQTLSKETGLSLPPTEVGALIVGCLGLAAIAVPLFILGLTFDVAALGWIATGAIGVAIVLAKLDRGRLPKHLSTVGGLARRTAPANFGRLVGQGARVTSSVTWKVLCEVIADSLDIEADEIGRDTLIHSLRKAVA